MINKVLYITVFILFSFHNCGIAQKSSLSLLPSGGKDINSYASSKDITGEATSAHTVNYEVYKITPQIKKKGKFSERRVYRLSKILGTICMKNWSRRMIRIFGLPTAQGLKL